LLKNYRIRRALPALRIVILVIVGWDTVLFIRPANKILVFARLRTKWSPWIIRAPDNFCITTWAVNFPLA
jgi:hypothetical protein